MRNKNTLYNKLWNTDILNLTVKILRDSLGLNSKLKVDYSDREIICHLIHACTSQTSVIQVSKSSSHVPSEGAIRNRLKNLDVEEVQRALNQMLKNKAVKTLPGK